MINPYYIWIKKRIDKNKNAIIVVNGATGSGKTFSSIKIAEDISKLFGVNFTVKTNLDFKFGGLLKKMLLPENEGKGVPFIFEEVGAMGGGAASREWQSKSNRLFFSFMQTARHRNQVLIFTCPHFTFLDAGTRKLVHSQLTTKGIDFKNKICYLRPYILQVNPNTGKIYFKFIRFIKERIHYKLNELQVKYPSEQSIKDYEEMKTNFTSELSRGIIEGDKLKKDKREGKIDYSLMDLLLREQWRVVDVARICQCSIKAVYFYKESLQRNKKM